MSALLLSESELAAHILVISDALPAHGRESRDSLAMLVASLTQATTAVRVLEVELRRLREFRLIAGGVR